MTFWGNQLRSPWRAVVSSLVWLAVCAAAAEWPPAPPLNESASRDVGLIPPSIAGEMIEPRIWRLTFTYKPDRPVRTVALAASFNSWNKSALLMKGPDAEGHYTTQVELGAGTYQYKFVLDDQTWVQDPLNPAAEPDNHGGFNSVLRVGKLASLTESNGQVGDGRIEPIGLVHQPSQAQYFQPLDGDEVEIRYRTLAHDVEQIAVALRDGPMCEMHSVLEDPLFTVWEAHVPLPGGEGGAATDREVEYTFVLTDGATRASDPMTYKTKVEPGTIFRTPEWARNAVWYQIMPDRFRNGSKDNDPNPVRPWTSEWFTPSEWEGKDGQTFFKYFVFSRLYGGDFQGVQEKLPYLKDLGVNALYFNPIFQSPSHHKYDAVNYLHVDEHLGAPGDYAEVAASEDLLDPTTWKWTRSDRVFLEFLKAAHAQGFKVIIDGVFNHVGRQHPAFQDVLKNGKHSRYADWFDVTSWEPFQYNGWAGHDSLPVFKKSADGLASASCKQHVFNVTRRWMDPDGDGDPSDGIDGWRLDVPNEIAMPFWAEWRGVVKSVNPNAYITGEIWDRADAWLDGRHFDAVMNYQFAKPAIEWLFNKSKRIRPTQLDRRLAELRLAYPAAATYVLQNLVGSHDTDRVVSMALNPDRVYDHENRVQDSNPKYNDAKPGPEEYQRARLLALLQMTYIGAPMIYYGDEVGMWGADDPTCRKPMLWEDLQPYEKPDENFVMTEQLDFYKRAIALRNAHPALRTGDFQSLLADDRADVWVFSRFDARERLIVALNASTELREVAVKLPERSPQNWSTVFGPSEYAATLDGKNLRIKLPPIGGVVLCASN
jgi:glycosidase